MTRLKGLKPRIKSLAAGSAIALLATGCGSALAPPAATVGDREITVAEVEDAVEAFRRSDGFAQASQGGDRGAVLRGFEQSFLSRQIRIAVFEPEAEALGLSVTEDDVDAQIADIQAGFENQSAFEEAMKEQGLTLPDLRALVYASELERVLREEVTGEIIPTDAEIADYYEANADSFTEVRSSHILVEDNATALELQDQLNAAGADAPELFADLARKHSIDTVSGEGGGDLGYSGYTEFVEPFARALQELEVGQISQPVRTEFGYHLILLTDRRVTPLEEVRDQIVSQLSGEQQDSAWQEWVTASYAAADIEVNPRYGELDLATQEIRNATSDEIPGAADQQPLPAPTSIPTPAG